MTKENKNEIRKNVLNFLTELYSIEEDSSLKRDKCVNSYQFCMESVRHDIAVNQLHMVMVYSQMLGIEAHYKGFKEIEVKNWGALADD